MLRQKLRGYKAPFFMQIIIREPGFRKQTSGLFLYSPLLSLRGGAFFCKTLTFPFDNVCFLNNKEYPKGIPCRTTTPLSFSMILNLLFLLNSENPIPKYHYYALQPLKIGFIPSINSPEQTSSIKSTPRLNSQIELVF